jgi:diguanylate cyclase (GGDEF)-like protein
LTLFGTLGRQLFAGVSLIFLLALAGVGLIYFGNARLYLQEQLESHAQDAATSLGLSLGSAAGGDDRALVETAINAIFDRGYYERIAFQSINGATVVEKQLPRTGVEVPDWFVESFPLHTPTATSLVTAGWRQLGHVSVTSHPRFAYRQLWRTALETLGWLAAIYALGLMAMRAFLTSILRPLGRIEGAAEAIARRDYQNITPVPRSRELRQVVQAINVLASRVREAIEAETERAERFRKEAFFDALTGLWNRRGVVEQFETHVRVDRDVHAAALLLLELEDFADFNRKHGYERGDDLLKLIAGILQDLAGYHGAMAGRWAGATFVLLVPNAVSGDAESTAAELCNRVDALLSEQALSTELPFNCGLAIFESGKPELSTMLASADGALQRARARGPGLFEVDSSAHPLGSMDWRRLIDEALSKDRVLLYQQAALSLPDQAPLHVEIISRLSDDTGQALPAAQFLPMAVRHGLVSRVDMKVIERLFAHLRAGNTGQTLFSVNVSSHSIAEEAFLSWLGRKLAAAPALASRLTFEMTEAGAMRDPDRALAFAALLRRHRARFALDNFGTHREAIRSLQRFLPDYVKLSSVYTVGLQEDQSKQFFVSSLVRVARSLDIRVISQAVEDASLLPLLSQLGISGYQGFAAARPAPLESQS